MPLEYDTRWSGLRDNYQICSSGNSQTANFKVYKGPNVNSRIFKALNFDFQIQELSRTCKVHANSGIIIIIIATPISLS